MISYIQCQSNEINLELFSKDTPDHPFKWAYNLLGCNAEIVSQAI